jgi:(4S)-4-hydroxy-5-phosphonooxypentane-2,3-dione isomerase
VISIVVRLRIRSGRRDQFLEAIGANAAASLRDEPGCRRFDVATSSEDPDAVLLYESYDDDSAFDAHLASAHFAEWVSLRSQLVMEGSQVTERFDVISPTPGPR